MIVKKINEKEIIEYLNWKYIFPNDFYNIPKEYFEEDLQEVKSNIENFYIVRNNNKFFGFYQYTFYNGEVEISLGIAPEFINKGNGFLFIKNCVDFLKENYNYEKITLRVIDTNKKAIYLYKKIGFEEIFRKQEKFYGKEVIFINMELKKD